MSIYVSCSDLKDIFSLRGVLQYLVLVHYLVYRGLVKQCFRMKYCFKSCSKKHLSTVCEYLTFIWSEVNQNSQKHLCSKRYEPQATFVALVLLINHFQWYDQILKAFSLQIEHANFYH